MLSGLTSAFSAPPLTASHHHPHPGGSGSGSDHGDHHSGGDTFESHGEVYRSFPNRPGYDPNFLGVNLPLPELDSSIKNEAAHLLDHPDQVELKYTHFSVIQDKDRRTPLVTADNIDGSQYQEIERSGKWTFDSRIAREYQIGNEGYSNNAIDKGHMVRRKDPMWGPQAQQGSDDTFVYTNCSLQHSELNQHHWLDLEDSILHRAQDGHSKMTVFTGPILREDDPKFDNNHHMPTPTQIPRAFWKVVAWNEPGKGLQSEAYVMSQADMLDLPQAGKAEEHLTPEQLQSYRVPLNQLEDMTHLHFGALKDR